MRFAAPRSTSPSPVRRHRKGRDSDSDDDSDAEPEEVASDSGDEFDHDTLPPALTRRPNDPRSAAEMRYLEDTVASIRLRTRHQDPYEDWEKETRREAMRAARSEHARTLHERHSSTDQAHVAEFARLAALHKRQVDEVAAQLAALERQRQAQETRLKAQWQERDRQLWQRIDAVIKFEEDKVRTALEEERVKREAEEKARKEEEERRVAEERRRQEEEEGRRRAEEEEKARDRQAEEERAQIEEEKRQRAETERRKRKSAGCWVGDAEEEWGARRKMLKNIKEGPMKTVKGNKELKALWSAGRRAINPKIGQITNEDEVINRVSSQICAIVRPSPAHPSDVYVALLSATAKTILLQAETEVTAEKRAAVPLARVAVNLMQALDGFADVLWAKLVQRTGGWPVPIIVPVADVDGVVFDKAARRKALGYKGEETQPERWARVAGIMRVYFEIVKASARAQAPLDPVFRMPRCWTYFARLVGNKRMLEAPVAPMVLHAGMDVMGMEAMEAYGMQWVKMLALLYEAATTGVPGGKMLGGDAPEGKSARVRVQVEIERIMRGGT